MKKIELTDKEVDILIDLIIKKEIEYQHSYDIIVKYEQTTQECYDFYNLRFAELSNLIRKLK